MDFDDIFRSGFYYYGGPCFLRPWFARFVYVFCMGVTSQEQEHQKVGPSNNNAISIYTLNQAFLYTLEKTQGPKKTQGS